MSVQISGTGVVVRRPAIESGYPGGMARYQTDAANLSSDDDVTARSFPGRPEAERWIDHLSGNGIAAGDVAIVAAADGSATPCPWLEVRSIEEGVLEACLRSADHGEPLERASLPRFEILSRSDSGLHYVRERRGGQVRVLTESELEDFNDPRPCPHCAEQFGCDHFNCAGEPLLNDNEIESEVPPEWTAFARDCGISRHDLERLRSIERQEGEYRVIAEASSDVRMIELVLLLNEAR